MKVLLVNGGAHPKGCTNRALEEVEKALKEPLRSTLRCADSSEISSKQKVVRIDAGRPFCLYPE